MKNERYALSIQRIKEIVKRQETEKRYQEYFKRTAQFLVLIDKTLHDSESKKLFHADEKWKQERNQKLYQDILPLEYEKSYTNPDYAANQLGKKTGQLLSAVYSEMYCLIAYAYENKAEKIVLYYELFLQLYCEFEQAALQNTEAAYSDIQQIFASFAFDYAAEFSEDTVRRSFTCEDDFAWKIVMESDLSDSSYLYDYGEYISENEKKMAAFLNLLPQETIQKIADTFTEGYRIGFQTTGKDISIKEAVQIRYFIGFERVVRQAVENFRELGMESIITRSNTSFMLGRSMLKTGYFSTIPNRQFECDHEYDRALFYDAKYVNRKLEVYQAALQEYKKETALFGGPAVIESFGEAPFSPIQKENALRLTKKQQQLQVSYTGKAGAILNQYVKGEERSFTIIAFPIPEIGENFKEIFEEVIKINTLDYIKYQSIQQTIIDALDQADTVSVKGTGKNQTDLIINLWKLQNKEKETIFENCVADVNIPVGEVFTSPVLKGTNGLLHVTEVFLNGLQFKDLKLVFQDGMVTDYSCSNFLDVQKGKAYIKDHILHQHETLPIGEFAIGTNTVAYMASKKYKIENIMPILIAEKTGPHFAVGDTCYSHEEDIMTFNPDGKAIVARENDISAARTQDIRKAYMNCHTDITIPYDELGELNGVTKDGRQIRIIQNGRFVLEGCSDLNKPFDE